MLFIRIYFCFLCFLVLSIPAYCGQIYLENGDRISGVIIDDNSEDLVTVETEAVGRISVEKKFIRSIILDSKKDSTGKANDIPDANEVREEKLWNGELSLGCNQSGGNTKESQLNIQGLLNRKTDHDEFTTRGDIYYSSTNKQMNAQRWRASLRYAQSFKNKRWYRYSKIEGDHDRFDSIGYRLVPSLGVGYWFATQEQFKLMADCGVGYEYTHYSNGSANKTEIVLTPRILLEKQIFSKLKIIQEVQLYPSLSHGGEYRLHSETSLITPINKQLALRFSIVDDYNSSPDAQAKKNDYRFISALSYSF